MSQKVLVNQKVDGSLLVGPYGLVCAMVMTDDGVISTAGALRLTSGAGILQLHLLSEILS